MTTDAGHGDIPDEPVIADQLIAGNIRYWRRAGGLTQEELGQRLGWSAANVSAAERSADAGNDRRRFDAQTLTELALALGVPLAALFLPPDDDGQRARYRFTALGRTWGMGELMELVVMPDTADESPLMDAYRKRFGDAARRAATGPAWENLVSRWTTGAPGVRDAAARQLRDAADRLSALAAMIAPEDGR